MVGVVTHCLSAHAREPGFPSFFAASALYVSARSRDLRATPCVHGGGQVLALVASSLIARDADATGALALR
jgi:hypothetical protein